MKSTNKQKKTKKKCSNRRSRKKTKLRDYLYDIDERIDDVVGNATIEQT